MRSRTPMLNRLGKYAFVKAGWFGHFSCLVWLTQISLNEYHLNNGLINHKNKPNFNLL